MLKIADRKSFIERFGLKRHYQAPRIDSNGPSKSPHTDSCYLLIFSMDLEGMGCQI
jgi:hypothetical protein